MKKTILVAAAAILSLEIAAPAFAQMDWLTPHLDAQRFGNQLRQNQRIAERNRKKRQSRKPAQKKDVIRYPKVQVNGKALQTSAAPIEKNGYTFVPFRDILEALGAEVAYNPEDRLITATRGNETVQLSLPGGDTSQMTGRKVRPRGDESPFIRNGVTMIPLRMVSERLGATVSYNKHPTSPTISINSPSA